MPDEGIVGSAQCSKLHTDDCAVPVPATQRLPDQQLIVPHAVVIAGVEQLDPGVKGRADRGDALWLIRRTIDTGHAHAAQPNRRDERTGRPQLSCDHQKPPVPRVPGQPTQPISAAAFWRRSVPRDTALKREEEAGDADDGERKAAAQPQAAAVPAARATTDISSRSRNSTLQSTRPTSSNTAWWLTQMLPMMRKLVTKAAYAGHSCANATASGSCARCAAARAGSARAGHGDGEDAVAERLRAACLAHGRRVIWIVHVELYTGLGSATPTAANARCQLIWALQRGEVAQACDVLQSDIGSVKGGTSADSG
jgi:hypothetical protein